MYLVEINAKTGFVDIQDTKDGVLAVKDFKALIDSLGIECFTCVALSVDYFSPIRHFAYKERHIKAMKEVVGNREAFNWADDIIQKACITYSALQYNPTLKELEILKEMRITKIEEIEKETETAKKLKLLKELNEIKDSQESFMRKADMSTIIQEAPVVNGYKLSRLEEVLTNKKSFYHEQEKQSPVTAGS